MASSEILAIFGFIFHATIFFKVKRVRRSHANLTASYAKAGQNPLFLGWIIWFVFKTFSSTFKGFALTWLCRGRQQSAGMHLAKNQRSLRIPEHLNLWISFKLLKFNFDARHKALMPFTTTTFLLQNHFTFFPIFSP